MKKEELEDILSRPIPKIISILNECGCCPPRTWTKKIDCRELYCPDCWQKYFDENLED